MPSIVPAAQLRTVLGVSVALYDDTYLNEILNTSESVILPMLEANTAAIPTYFLESNIAYFYTQRPNKFVAGQSVIVSGLPAPFTATHTVITGGYNHFTAAITNANVTKRESIPAGVAYLSGYNAATIYAAEPAVAAAVLAVAVEVFQSRVAAGGEIQGVDFAPSPYRMGRSLTNRVSSLLTKFLDTDSMLQ
ncbi:hypothetical protein UFOVP1261_8 [uncultured Caudovirales phage]|uniref:Uncharacterized protein n=1 Tax=uncultured Caudovirales phage TaxID=2100421 RepID=A0A6J5T333_9CAUD|nr:hypothetical protein UFOVP1261_8 [uncultured Caudovirales phage]CAB4221970.1 hypothetical protein UFOVP1650_22 [uncultured Caudovirales phage]